MGGGGGRERCGRTKCIMVYVKIVKKRSGEETQQPAKIADSHRSSSLSRFLHATRHFFSMGRLSTKVR